VNGDHPAPSALDEPPRYLPPDLAGFLRELLARMRIVDPQHRADLTSLAEMAFQRGNGEGYSRGYHDGIAERDLQFAELNQGVDVLGGTAVQLPAAMAVSALVGGDPR